MRSRTPVIHLNLESSSEDELNTVREPANPTSKKAKFEIPLEADSDEDMAQDKKEGQDKSESSMYERINQYVRTLALTPLTSGTVGELQVKVAPQLEGCQSHKFYCTPSYSGCVGDVKLEDETLNEIIELLVFSLCS